MNRMYNGLRQEIDNWTARHDKLLSDSDVMQDEIMRLKLQRTELLREAHSWRIKFEACQEDK